MRSGHFRVAPGSRSRVTRGADPAGGVTESNTPARMQTVPTPNRGVRSPDNGMTLYEMGGCGLGPRVTQSNTREIVDRFALDLTKRE